MEHTKSYYPITATPFKKDNSYRELAPCKVLQPYIRCYWGTEKPLIREERDPLSKLVIPDTCADIIYNIDESANTVSGGFCGVNDCSFYTSEKEKAGHAVATFSIRFYAWSAYAFVGDSLRATLNGYFRADSLFEWLDRMIRPKLLELRTLEEKAAFAEELLLKRLSDRKENRLVDSTVSYILDNRGSLEVADLAREFFISTRQLERLFHEYIGITPKKLSNLIRYQFLWRDIVCEPDFDLLNAVHKYGYTDQSHLLREFRKYHSMDIHRARTLAFQDVGNIQEARG